MSPSPAPDDGPPSVPDARPLSTPDARLLSVPDACLLSAPDGSLSPAPDAGLLAAPDAPQPSAPDAQPISATDARPPGEAILIPDNLMVFRSFGAPPLKCLEKKKALRLEKSKVRLRKSTPAPASKRDGRKRPVISPFPEDKPTRKKIVFGKDGGSSPTNFEARNLVKAFEEVIDASVTMVDGNIGDIIPSPAESPSPETVAPAGGEGAADHPMEHALDHSRSKSKGEEGGNSKMGLGGKFVNFPDLVLETKQPLESGLEATHAGESRVGLAVGGYAQPKSDDTNPLAQPEPEDLLERRPNLLFEDCLHIPKIALETNFILESALEPCYLEKAREPLAVGELLQPKRDNLLLLACLDSADTLDVAAAQPLLAGIPPEKSQCMQLTEVEALPENDVPMMQIEETAAAQEDLTDEMEAQPSYAHEGSGGIRAWGGPAPTLARSEK